MTENRQSEVYLWKCPVDGCTISRATVGKKKARNNLLSHIQTIGGDNHGPNGTYPDDVDVDLFTTEYVLKSANRGT